MIQIVPALYWDNRNIVPESSEKVTLDGQLYCDEEGLLTGKQRNYRASQMRKWYFDRYYKNENISSDDAAIVGDACFVVAATDENMKIMEAILDA